MYLKHVVLAGLAVFALTACGGGEGGGGNPVDPNPPVTGPPSAPVASATINTTAATFTPSQVSLTRGGTVVFNIGAVAHNVIFANVSGAPANIPVTSNEQVSRTFGAQGSFSFDCTLHAGMSGTINVQ